ncbi:MAG: hypothetical protein OTJ97_09040, partial [SAR202 cluster bacterium]|nr:hypothetical protein [SAR202 cluster bacterium]
FLGLVTNILEAGSCWGRVLSSAAGLFAHICMFRREGYSIMSYIYKELQRLGPGGHKVMKISAPALDELAVAACLLPLLGTSLRAVIDDHITCTDASGGAHAHGGVTRASVPHAVAEDLWRHRLRKVGKIRFPHRSESELLKWLETTLDDVEGIPIFDAPASSMPERFFGDISGALSWKTVVGYKIKPVHGREDHINIYEHRAATTGLVAEIRRSGGNRRLLLGCDSDVVCCVIAKGRSGSTKLNHYQRRLGMQLLLSGVHVGVLRTPTGQNTADAPSRRRATREGPADQVPAWAVQYVNGDLDALQPHVAADLREQFFRDDPPGRSDKQQSSSPAEQLSRVVFELDRMESLVAGGSARFRAIGTRPGDPNLIGDGPRHTRERPTGVSLLGPLIGDREVIKRSAIFEEFVAHAFQEGVDEDALWSDAIVMTQALRLFGQHLWQIRRARGGYSRLVNAVRDRRPTWATSLRGAWDVDRKWQVEEPTEHRTPLPRAFWEAAVVAALLLGLIPFATSLLLGFWCALRPGELLRLTRRTVMLPEDLGENDNTIFVVLDKPKTRNRAARTQHVKLDDPLALHFLRWRLRPLAMDEKIYPGSSYLFLKEWQKVFGVLVTTAFCPSSLRAGAASDLYKRTNDLDLVRWVLRHASQGCLESYIQELPFALINARPSPATRAKVEQLQPQFIRALTEAPSGCFGEPRAGHPANQLVRRKGRRRRSRRDQLACELDGAFWSAPRLRPGANEPGSVWLRIEESDVSLSSDDSE